MCSQCEGAPMADENMKMKAEERHDYDGGLATRVRKETELDNLMMVFDKELSALGETVMNLIDNLRPVLAPERDDDRAAESMPSPSSPLGESIAEKLYRVQSIRNKLKDADERLRV